LVGRFKGKPQYFTKTPEQIQGDIIKLGEKLLDIYNKDLEICKQLGSDNCTDFWWTIDCMGLNKQYTD